MAGLDNPFASLLNPDRQEAGTFTNFLSKLSGQKSLAAEASGSAIQAITEDIQRGTDPQKAVVNFFSSPAGVQAFTNNPNIMAQIGETIKNITAPPMQAIQTGPGGRTTLINPNTGGQQTITQPTAENQNFQTQGRVVQTSPGSKSTVMGPGGNVQQTITQAPADVQTFQEMARLAQLPIEEQRKYAEANMMVNGRYQFLADKNAFGEPTGSYSVGDRLTGTFMTPQSAGTGRQKPEENKPGITTVPNDMLRSDGSVDYQKLAAGKAGMFLGAGFWPSVTSTLNSATGSFIHPSLGSDTARAATDQRRNLEDLRTAITLFPEVAGRTNKVIDQMKKNFATGWFTDPIDAVRTSIQFHDDIHGEISSAENTIRDPNQPKNVKTHAAKEIQAYNRILRTLPLRGEMVALEKGIRSNQIPGLGATQAGHTLWELGGNAVNATVNVLKGQEPLPPGQTTPQVDQQNGLNIATIPPADLAKLDPRKLSPQQRIQLQERLRSLLQRKQ